MHKGQNIHRIISLVLLTVFSISLCSCGQSKESRALDEKIKAVGEVTLESEQQIVELEEAYNALNDEDRGTLKNGSAIAEYRKQYEQLLEQKALDDAAKSVESSINGIGIPGLGTESKIKDARKKYDSASPEVQALVSNYDTLLEAEEALHKFKAESVNNMIKGLSAADDPRNFTKIKEIKNAYKLLTEDEKAFVENYDSLETQEKTYLDMFEQALASLTVEEDQFYDHTYYLGNSQPKYADDRSYILPYVIKQKAAKTRLVATYDYVGRDWVFYDEIIIMTDNKKYTKNFDYYSIDHEVGNVGAVTELIQEDVPEKDIEMFWDIAYSEKVEVRFVGRQYAASTYTMSEEDKQSIKDVLMAYYYLSN